MHFFSQKQHSRNNISNKDISKDIFIFCSYSFTIYFVKYIDKLVFHSKMVFFTTRPLKCCLFIWDVTDMPDTPFLFFAMLFILVEVILLSKRGILYHDHYLKIIFVMSRYFPIPKLYFDIKMAISHNKQSILLDIITYPLNYLNCGFSWKCPSFCPVLWDLPCHFLALQFFF